MTLKPVDRVRKAVNGRLAQMSGSEPNSVYETILIRNGLFCGRKFQWQGYEVVWFMEEDEIKFFSPCGNLLTAESIIPFLENYQQSDAGFSQFVDNQSAASERRAA
jgi:hypothetical protein